MITKLKQEYTCRCLNLKKNPEVNGLDIVHVWND